MFAEWLVFQPHLTNQPADFYMAADRNCETKSIVLNGILKGAATAQSPQIKISMIEAITPTACRKKQHAFCLLIEKYPV